MNTQPEANAVEDQIRDIVKNQRAFFRTKATLPVEFRLEQLKKL